MTSNCCLVDWLAGWLVGSLVVGWLVGSFRLGGAGKLSVSKTRVEVLDIRSYALPLPSLLDGQVQWHQPQLYEAGEETYSYRMLLVTCLRCSKRSMVNSGQ